MEIDYYPNCRGVWLARGESEKIIESSNSFGSHCMGDDDHHKYKDSHHDHNYNYEKHSDYGHHSKRKKGFFSELFDF